METWWHQNEDGTLNFEKVASVIMKHVPKGSDAEFGLDMLRQRIAALEAEKAERERQEPAGQVIGINTVQWKGHGPVLGAKLYYAPPALREPTEEECSKIAIEAGHRLKTEAARIAIGRAMFNAVKKVMG